MVIDFPGGSHRDEVLFSSDHIRGYMISMPYCAVNAEHLQGGAYQVSSRELTLAPIAGKSVKEFVDLC